MFKNYLKTTMRTLRKNKAFALISILGLSLGMAVCALVLLYVQHELSFDRFHADAEKIYRLCQPDHPYHAPQVAQLIADELPEIEDHARILVRGTYTVEYNDLKFKEDQVCYADASLFRLFSFKFKYGIPETALKDPYSIVISEKIAEKYFGQENPIGKVMRLDNEADYMVGGVMENMPSNSHFRYDIIGSLTDAQTIFGEDWMHHWGWQNFLIYFKIHEAASPAKLADQCEKVIAAHLPGVDEKLLPKYSLQPLCDIHLYSAHIENDIQPQNSITYVLIFSAIGILILLIACFNYVNLLTANASMRVAEIGMKKTLGATRKQLILQFIGESCFVLLLALTLSLIIVEFSLPTFNALSGLEFTFSDLLQTNMLLSLATLFIITALLASFYPAFFLSGLQPVQALKSASSHGTIKYNFRKVLVSAQFTVVIILICSALFMARQINFLQNKELGFDKSYTLVSELPVDRDVSRFQSLKQALLQESVVTYVAAASRFPADDLNNWGSALLIGKPMDDFVDLPFVHISHDYFETLGITAVEGRLYSKELESDKNDALVLTKSALKKLDIHENPIGKSVGINWPQSKRKIVGVVDDFHFESLHKNIQPVIFVIDYSQCGNIAIRVKPSNITETKSRITKVCESFYPDLALEFRLLDEKVESAYQSDQRTFKLMGYFTALAIFIACMGLFGLAAFIIKRRTKEIGVRKVLGASLANIFMTVTKDFAIWVLLANIIAIPVTWYAMNKWLQNFAYRVEISWWMFALAGGLTLLIALLTVSWQAIRAATANPVDALRYE